MMRVASRLRRAGRSARADGAGGFRADPAAVAADRPSRVQATALLATLALTAAGVATASYVVSPDTARTFDLVHGSVFLTDQVAPVGIDLASGRPTLRLVGADKQVDAARPTNLALVPVTDGTLMIDKQSGQFNMVDETGFVIKHDGGGVLLPRRTDTTTAAAVAAQGGAETGVAGAAYIVRTGPRGTNVLLVNQSTVEVASNGRRTVQPRAQLTLPDAVMPGADSLAGAGGDLWALIGTGERHEVGQFAVPAQSDTGARLVSHLRGSVEGPAAIGTASTGADGSGGTAVAVASADRILFFPADGSTMRSVALPAVAGVDTVLPASGGQGRICFLVHGDTGWNLISIAADGTRIEGPTRVSGLPASAQPARPAWSNGALYTVNRSTGGDGGIVRITADGRAAAVRGAAQYPVATKNGHVAETHDFSDAYVVARGARVLINSPSHTQAVALFTDGARRPLIIRKSSAVDVSVAGGAEALTQRNIDPSDERGNRSRGTVSQPTAGTQINNQVDCANTLQKPHVPVLSAPTPPGSRSVGLQWTYPTLDPQDCIPSTYVVKAVALSANAPSSGGEATVHNQTGVTLTGLYPKIDYEITVTAYLHGQGTSSRPIRVSTGAEGPSAPTGLRVRADSSGNWILNWSGCGTGSGCVPVSDWRVVASVCDGQGVSSPPAPLEVAGDPTSRAQPQIVYRGGGSLLGRGLRFQILGIGANGATGESSPASDCVYSWRPPNPSAVTVAASRPAGTSADGTTSITASVRFAGSAADALGGVGGTLTYQLLAGGAPVETVGPTTDTAVQLDGVAAGRTYTVQVQASPPRHPDVVVTVGSAAVDPAVALWPTVGVSAGFDSGGSNTAGTLTVSFGLGGTSARGEHFDLVDSALTCGANSIALDRDDVTIGADLTYPVDRFETSGDCRVTVQLRQNAQHSTSPPLFGAGPSGTTTEAVTIPVPSSTATAADFTATWGSDPDHPTVVVSYGGSDPESLMSDWQLTVTNGSTADCGSSVDAPTATVAVAPACITAGGTFQVSVDYTYVATGHPHFDLDVGGTRPAPMDPAQIHFTAVWGGDADNPTADVTYDGQVERDRLSAADWTEKITSPQYPDVAACGQADTKDPGFQLISLPLDESACPPGYVDGDKVTYQVTITYTDPYQQQNTYTPTVDGDPPS